MDFQQIWAIVISVIVLVVIVLPFFTGKGGALASASAINDPSKLDGLKKAIINRFIEEEKAFESGDISSAQWNQRSKLLSNRYIDVSKRLDFIKGQE
jgi:NADH:ubiquinone oxidoreductase subunit 3 (subunit A)